jgi:hypothetical protein
MPVQSNCLRVISRAYKATPIRNLKLEVGVPYLGIHLDSIQAQFRVRLEESVVAGVIGEAVEKVERWIRGAAGKAGGRGRQRAERWNQGNSRGGTLLDGQGHQGERGAAAKEGESVRRAAGRGVQPMALSKKL